MTFKDKNIKIFLSLIFSLVILLSAYYFIDNNQYKKQLNQDTVNQVAKSERSNFPLVEDGVYTYNFICRVTEVIFPNFKTLDNKVIEVGAKCQYLDINNNEQNIKVPLIVNDANNNIRLAGSRTLTGDYSLWNPEDLIHILEMDYYGRIGINTGLYEEPKENNYWQDNTKKPTLNIGDDIAVAFALEQSNLRTIESLSKEANFNKAYHTKIYTYKNISSFVQTGDPKLLDHELDGWIIPLWAEFISDNNNL
ncbi:hypothetical protein KA089_00980 [Candidatus Woesebacteria bacterium]|nr:hypothetical protein [Candidatus Woesebacteria bacterium]